MQLFSDFVVFLGIASYVQRLPGRKIYSSTLLAVATIVLILSYVNGIIWINVIQMIDNTL